MSQIHTSIINAMRLIAKTGIAKDSRNKDQGYNFRGIEAAMNEMSPILISCGITISATYADLATSERESKSGGKLRFCTLKGSFRFEADDGSFVVSEAYGEGMDSSDKATAKAMSVAFRTALFQQFIVPTMAMDPEEGDRHALPTDALAAAEKGLAAYQAFWTNLQPEQRKAMQPHHEELKAIAADSEPK